MSHMRLWWRQLVCSLFLRSAVVVLVPFGFSCLVVSFSFSITDYLLCCREALMTARTSKLVTFTQLWFPVWLLIGSHSSTPGISVTSRTLMDPKFIHFHGWTKAGAIQFPEEECSACRTGGYFALVQARDDHDGYTRDSSSLWALHSFRSHTKRSERYENEGQRWHFV